MQIFLYLYKDYYSEHILLYVTIVNMKPHYSFCHNFLSLICIVKLFITQKFVIFSIKSVSQNMNFRTLFSTFVQLIVFSSCLLLKRLLLHHPTFHCLMTPWRENDMCPLGRTSHDVTCILLLC